MMDETKLLERLKNKLNARQDKAIIISAFFLYTAGFYLNKYRRI